MEAIPYVNVYKATLMRPIDSRLWGRSLVRRALRGEAKSFGRNSIGDTWLSLGHFASGFPVLWQRANYKLGPLLSAEKDAANLVHRLGGPECLVFAYPGVHR